MEIKTVKEILSRYDPLEIYDDNHDGNKYQIYYHPKDIENAMKEYANQFIDLAAEEAICSHYFNGRYQVDKESILKVKQLIK